jgi:hypothetical protein
MVRLAVLGSVKTSMIERVACHWKASQQHRSSIIWRHVAMPRHVTFARHLKAQPLDIEDIWWRWNGAFTSRLEL